MTTKQLFQYNSLRSLGVAHYKALICVLYSSPLEQITKELE